MKWGVGEPVRALYGKVARWLDELPTDLLASRRAQAEYMFRRIGITFGVYGDKDAAERLIPFDIVPRLIFRAEWRKLEAGLTQRVKALNLFLRDVYGERRVLKEGIIPPDSIVRNAYYRPEMIGRSAPHDIWVHIAGIDIVRVDDEFVLRSRGQRAHAVRRLLHAGKPGSDDAAVAGPVRPSQGGAGRRLPGRTARLPALGRAPSRPGRRDDSSSRPASTIRPITSTRSSPTSSGSNWSRVATCSSRTTRCSRAPRSGPAGSTSSTAASTTISSIPWCSIRTWCSASRAWSVLFGGQCTIANAIGTGVADDKAIYSYVPD